ncbi:MAG: ParB/RepB/Spo0J family partition protein [Spirochaetales bacterium]|jgi:ParB/RepB/Spo0J family partition protein|nr:ParB/RepB/Spo0J family partition protein [Spirochaetales bacterium]
MSTIIQEVPLSEFDLSLASVRIMNPARILQVEKSMRVHGQLQPVIARVHEDKYQLIDGFKRFFASENLLIEALQCRVLDIDLPRAKVLLLSYNRPHRSMEAWEEALVLRDLQQIHSLDQRSLAELLGYSRSWVSRRLSLIEKIDEKVSSQIMMGSLTSSQARALTKLPRGNQCAVASSIVNFNLTSRQSDTLVEAFLKAKDEDQQQYILTHPEHVLKQEEAYSPQDPYDVRLSAYGNDLMHSMMHVLQGVHIMLSRLSDQRMGMLSQSESVIITPLFEKVTGCINKLTKVITELQIHKSTQQDEK